MILRIIIGQMRKNSGIQACFSMRYGSVMFVRESPNYGRLSAADFGVHRSVLA